MQFKIKTVFPDGKCVISETRYSYENACNLADSLGAANPCNDYSIISFSPIWDVAINSGLMSSEEMVDRLIERTLNESAD